MKTAREFTSWLQFAIVQDDQVRTERVGNMLMCRTEEGVFKVTVEKMPGTHDAGR